MSIRVASVEFFNSKPLLEGLDADRSIALSLAVPSALLALLAANRADVALLPTIDYQALPGLRVLPVGGIGCDGPTLTVRLFARVPITRVTRVACDPDSHTSVALAKILFANHFRTAPRFVPLADATDDDHEARLLIGDKVICEPPSGFGHQVDLGEAWKQMTGLPFVFAVWTARGGVELGDVPARLAAARVRGLAAAPGLVDRFAVRRGWPADVALRYLTHYLKFEIGEPQLDAIRRFHGYADALGLLPGPARALDVAFETSPGDVCKERSRL